jgi:ketosteroid isomerase-like protein
MSVGGESVVRAAYAAYARGDVAGVLEFVHPELEWTYLNPMEANPAPQTCHGREELARASGARPRWDCFRGSRR